MVLSALHTCVWSDKFRIRVLLEQIHPGQGCHLSTLHKLPEWPGREREKPSNV